MTQEKLKVRFRKTVEEAITPFYAKPGDAGMDLTAVSQEYIDNEHVKYGFGLEMEIPKGYGGFIFPRSSCYQQRQLMSNCVGVVDSGYRGEVSAIMLGNSIHSYKVGDRVAQIIIMPYPSVEWEEVDELSASERGNGGYGHTGK